MKCLLTLFLLISGQLHAGTPVVVIGNHYSGQQLKGFASWAAEQLDLGPNAYILITFTYNMPHRVAGYTLYETHTTTEGTIHQYMIRLQGDQHLNAIRRTLAHELVHVKQIHEGRLVLHEGKHVTWNEKWYQWPYWEPHDRRPWEDEANGLSLDLVTVFRKEHT